MTWILRRRWRLLVLFLVGLFWALGMTAEPGAAQIASGSDWTQRGWRSHQSGNYTEALAAWSRALEGPTTPAEAAILYANLGRTYYAIGQPHLALDAWKEAIELYQTVEGDRVQLEIARLTLERGQAFDALGMPEHARRQLDAVRNHWPDNADRDLEETAATLEGNIWRSLGEYDNAIAAYKQTRALARQADDVAEIASALGNLGATYERCARRYRYRTETATAEGDDDRAAVAAAMARECETQAIASFAESADLEIGGLEEARALAGLNRAAIRFPSDTRIDLAAKRSRAAALLADEPDSRDKAFILVNLARYWDGDPQSEARYELLHRALEVARTIDDRRAESYAAGDLGHLYELAGDSDRALSFSQTAQYAAQESRSTESLYLWQWQAGRILAKTHRRPEAIAAYLAAMDSLEEARSEVVPTNLDAQADFKDLVEPVYRQLLTILLDPEDKRTGDLETAREVLERLKISELQNFFGDNCVRAESKRLRDEGKALDPNAAYIYTIVFPDRLEIVARFRESSWREYIVPISKADLTQKVDRLRFTLEKRTTNEYLKPARELYELLITPIAAELEASAPRTVVFIHDGALRKVPMSALYNGTKFAIELYPIAVSPGLSITERTPFDRSNTNTLLMGLTVSRHLFPALPNVKREIEIVASLLPEHTILLDEEFTFDNFVDRVRNTFEPVEMVHIATHGEFGVDGRHTFLVAYDELIPIRHLDRAIRNRFVPDGFAFDEPIQLLVLSACQTAAGDSRSALGMGGVAVRAGAKTALATLWSIDDADIVPIIEIFYRQLLKPENTVAEALQAAQLQAIADFQTEHPAVWSPLIAIGNWQ